MKRSNPDGSNGPSRKPRVVRATKGLTYVRSSPPQQDVTADEVKYLRMVLDAPVYDVAIESPLTLAKNLSNRIQNRVYLKREDLQPVFSFKLRGAYNRMRQLTPEEKKKGVVTCSAGNHAQGEIILP
jgi:threonine synthase